MQSISLNYDSGLIIPEVKAISPTKKSKLVKDRRNTLQNVDYFDSFKTFKNQSQLDPINSKTASTFATDTFATNPQFFKSIGPGVLAAKPGVKEANAARDLLKSIKFEQGGPTGHPYILKEVFKCERWKYKKHHFELNTYKKPERKPGNLEQFLGEYDSSLDIVRKKTELIKKVEGKIEQGVMNGGQRKVMNVGDWKAQVDNLKFSLDR